MAHETQPRVLIVADDLTGALDTSGPFAQQGLTTMVMAQPLDSDADAVRDARVVSINTDSRHLGPAAAADRVERCVRHFARQRFDIVFKKIDSTLRGNVTSETMALMNVCDRAIQTMGALGVSDDTPVAAMWRNGRALRIVDGPDEVHKMVIARRELQKYA